MRRRVSPGEQAAADAIVAELHAVFPAVRSFAIVPDGLPGDERYETAAAFADKPAWADLSPEWLDGVPDGLGSALHFLSDEAVRFYIPAYLVADLRGGLACAEPVFTLVHGFDDMGRLHTMPDRLGGTPTRHAHARWDALNQAQAVAIVKYLEWVIHRDGLDLAFGAAEALSVYWSPRAAGERPAPG